MPILFYENKNVKRKKIFNSWIWFLFKTFKSFSSEFKYVQKSLELKLKK